MNPFSEEFLPKRWLRDARSFAEDNRKLWPYAGIFVGCLLVYAFSHSNDEVVHIYKSETSPDFKDARVLGSQGDSIYEGKERLLLKTLRELKEGQTALQAKIQELEKGRSVPVPISSPLPYGPIPLPSPDSSTPGVSPTANDPRALLSKDAIQVSPPPEALPVTTVPPMRESRGEARIYVHREKLGSSILSFPVKDLPQEVSEGVVLPTGSYVKAKLMTGVEAPEGKTYPALLQLDYAYIVPNHHKLDLSGCFMIAKSQGDLSTERVQMQATKLSCVSRAGKMFEREVNGFVADDKDNSFAVIGSVNSKQDRVAAMAFLSSIVEGVGKAIQSAQTTQQMTPLGGSQSMLTGNQMEYIGAGGAASAAGMVTQWYLRQAQNLLPTINVGSGQDLWIVMQDTVKLPNDYFRKNASGGANESVYTYFSRVVD